MSDLNPTTAHKRQMFRPRDRAHFVAKPRHLVEPLRLYQHRRSHTKRHAMQRDRRLRAKRPQRPALAVRRAEVIVGNNFDDVDSIEIRKNPERQFCTPSKAKSITHGHDPPQPPHPPPPHELPPLHDELLVLHELPQSPSLAHEFDQDRKSTRLNSSHSQISYAVF